MKMFPSNQIQFTSALMPTLGQHEDKTSIDKWYTALRSNLRTSSYKEFMDLQWSPTSTINRGFTDTTENGKTTTALAKSNLVDAMLDQITGFAPELSPEHV